jgi:hypothetical protein
MFVRRGDLVNCDEWAQHAQYIENLSSAANGHTSMVYRHKLPGDLDVAATLCFTDRMAPAIVLAGELGCDEEQRPLYEEHMEFTLWDNGVNIWLHRTENGKPAWEKIAQGAFPLQKNVKYQLQVQRRNAELAISVDGHTINCRCEALPNELYAGVTACEGINRLYDFAVRSI